MEQWTDGAFLAEARAWIEAHAPGRVLAVEQPHVRPWSTAMRVETTTGVVWFKANHETQAYEGALTRILAEVRPALLPELLATEDDRAWMLTADAGERLRELVAREHSVERWLDVLPLYADLQLAATPRAVELVATGAPAQPLSGLPAGLEQLADEGPGAPYRGLVPRVAELAEEIAGLGLADTIQHNDLHDAQVFVRDGRVLISDWGDAVVSHPFCSMSITLEGVISWGPDDVEASADTAPYAAAYLEAFTAVAPRRELERALAVALRLGWLARTLDVAAFLLRMPEDVRAQQADGLPLRLELFARGLDELG